VSFLRSVLDSFEIAGTLFGVYPEDNFLSHLEFEFFRLPYRKAPVYATQIP